MVLRAAPRALEALHPLFKLAVLAGQEDALLRLITRGHDLNARDTRGRTPLMIAAAEGHGGTCRLLLDAGADAHLQGDDGRDALILATERGHQDVASLLQVSLSRVPEARPTVAIPSPDEAVLLADGLSPSSWDEEPTEVAAPAQRDSWVPGVQRMQQLLSTHSPLDSSADWSDVDVNLPASRHLTVFSEERLSRLGALLRHGLVTGILSPSAVEAAAGGDGQAADALETHHLLQVIGDLGIDVAEIDDDDRDDDPADERTERAITEALDYLATLATTADDLEALYLNAVRPIRRPSAEEEAAATDAYKQGIAECLRAVAACPPVRDSLLALPRNPSVSCVLGEDDDPDSAAGPPEPGTTQARPACAHDEAEGATFQVADPPASFTRSFETAFLVLGHLNDTATWPATHADTRNQFVTNFREATAARAKLIEGHLWLVSWIARRYGWCSVPFLDLVQEGSLGLIRAVETYDYTKGARLSTYAAWSIRLAIRQAIPRQTGPVRIPPRVYSDINSLNRAHQTLLQELNRDPTREELATRMGIPDARIQMLMALEQPSFPISELDAELVERVGGDRAATPEEIALSSGRSRALTRVLVRLNPRELEVLRLRYGLGDAEELTLDAVGRVLSLTRERIRQIESAVLKRLKKSLSAMWSTRA
jgi:RNA polymerase primary sigma factor